MLLTGLSKLDHRTFACVVIQDGKHPQGSAPYCPITVEVLVLGLYWKSRRVASADDLPLARRNPQPKRSPQALDASLAHGIALLPK